VALLTAQELSVVVLLDDEPEAAQALQELQRSKLIRGENVIRVSAAIEPAPAEADIEDLIDPAVFEGLVKEPYANELAGRPLALDLSLPRIAPRVSKALGALDIAFHKSRVARMFVTRMAAAPGSVANAETLGRFQRLFERIGAAVRRVEADGRAPFA